MTASHVGRVTKSYLSGGEICFENNAAESLCKVEIAFFVRKVCLPRAAWRSPRPKLPFGQRAANGWTEPTLPNDAPRSNRSEAQISDAAKLRTLGALRNLVGPKPPSPEPRTAAVQIH